MLCICIYATISFLAKAGRDAFFRVVSVEEPSIRVLNFNPGPIITDMQKAVEHLAWDEGVKNWSRG